MDSLVAEVKADLAHLNVTDAIIEVHRFETVFAFREQLPELLLAMEIFNTDFEALDSGESAVIEFRKGTCERSFEIGDALMHASMGKASVAAIDSEDNRGVRTLTPTRLCTHLHSRTPCMPACARA